MKTIKCVMISVAMGLLFVNTALANNYIPVIKVVDKKIHLSLDNGSATATVQVLNHAGKSLVEEQVMASEQFESVFNLESIPSGAYTLVIKSDYQETVQPITINQEGVVMDKSDRKVYFPAAFSKKSGTLKISMLNPTSNDVRLYVLDAFGRKSYQETIKNETNIEKDFKLRYLPAGQYTVVVDNANRLYTKNVTVQ